MAEANKIDSNVTGLRIAAETSIGTLPGSPVWYELEPNSYTDFGPSITTVARNPISSKRKRQKGVVTDLDAAGGFNQDLTFTNFSPLFPGAFLSSKRTKFLRHNAASDTPITDVETTTDTVTFAADVSAVVRAGDIHFFSGFGQDANNGIKTVASVSAAVVTYNENMADEAVVPVNARIEHVGFRFAADDADIARTAGSLPQLTTTAKDLTQLGLIPGEFVFIGGDSVDNQFAAAHNNGFARVRSIAANAITFDKTSGGADGETEMATEASADADDNSAIDIYFANSIIRDEDSDASEFSFVSYTLERRLGVRNPTTAPSEVQSEAIQGAVLNELAINIGQADKITIDATFIGTDAVQRDGGAGEALLSATGTIASLESTGAYNTSSDFTRIKLATVRPTQGGTANLAAPIPLFAFATEVSINLNNNASPNKAVGTLGAFDVTAGTFEVGGSITAYFADIDSVAAVKNNSDVTLDIAAVKSAGTGSGLRKTGLVFDIPLISLGDGRLNVSQNEAITLPLQTNAAEETTFGHTFIIHEFNFLPNAADT